jgi:membrane-associated phospholipid phosphatase
VTCCGVSCGLVAKVLKRILRDPRPATALALRKHDPGMPSTHAACTFFFAVHLALQLSMLRGGFADARAAAVAAGLGAAAVGNACHRVQMGAHTAAQVIAGAALGVASAAAWHAAVHPRILAAWGEVRSPFWG